MRAEIDQLDAGGLHAIRPFSRSLVDTAALDLGVLAAPRPLGPDALDEWRSHGSGFSGVTTLTLARSLHPSEQTGTAVGEELWARPTSDIADLVAQVRTQLGVRRTG